MTEFFVLLAVFYGAVIGWCVRSHDICQKHEPTFDGEGQPRCRRCGASVLVWW